MKKKILALATLAVLTVPLHAGDYTHLVFTLSDGTTRSITATSLELTFGDGTLTATSGTESIVLPLTALTKMEFSNDGTSGIQPLTLHDTATAGDLYDLNGRRLGTGTLLNGQLPKGVYIIKSNGQSTKVQVK